MIKTLAIYVWGVFWLFALSVANAATQDLGAVRQLVEQYVKLQTTSLPGQKSVTVGAIEPIALAGCAKMEAFLPLGGKLWGQSNVGVRCATGADWTLYVPVMVRVQGPVVVAIRPLPSNKPLMMEDLTQQIMELTQLPAGVIVHPEEAIGKTLVMGVMAGHPIRQDMLRAPLVIKYGQSVKLIAQGQGFRVSSEGKAMGNAAAGQMVQVKAQNGQVVNGIARPDGSVEVQP